MEKFFDIDNPLMRFLSRMADLMILNIITFILCIPVITAGAAFTAMHYILLKMVRDEECYIVKPYFKSFKENFKQATIEWVIILLLLLIFWMDMEIVKSGSVNVPGWLLIGLFFIVILVYATMLYVFPLQSHFVNTVKNTFKNSFLIMIMNLPKTVLMAVIMLVPFVLLFLPNGYGILFLVLFGISVPGFVCAMLYNKVFKKLEPETEKIASDLEFSVNMEDMEVSENQDVVEEIAAVTEAEQPLEDLRSGETTVTED